MTTVSRSLSVMFILWNPPIILPRFPRLGKGVICRPAPARPLRANRKCTAIGEPPLPVHYLLCIFFSISRIRPLTVRDFFSATAASSAPRRYSLLSGTRRTASR